MLNRRLHILLDDETVESLRTQAKMARMSIGELVRKAVRAQLPSLKEKERKKRQKAMKAILALRPKFLGRFEKLDYHDLIEHGRHR